MPTKKNIKTKAKKSVKTSNATRSRRLKQPKYKSFRISKPIHHQRGKLSPARRLLWQALRHLVAHWKVFGGVIAVYAVLTLLLVRGFSVNSTLPQTKLLLETFLHGAGAKITGGVTLFGVLLGSNTSVGDAASAYQSMLVVVISLALIWTLRQTYNSVKIRIREAFYRGEYPLVPFILVLIVIGLQLIPLLASNMLYGFVFGNGLAVTMLEKVMWGILFFMMVLLTLYMVTSSVFALYIVTLPDVTPLQALRSARELVRFRRWTVMRKFLFLPVVLLIMAAIILVPIILYATVAAEWVYFALTMIGLAILHSYMYGLYRELIA